MIDLVEKYNLTLGKVLKIAGLAFAVLFVIFLVTALLSSLNMARNKGGAFLDSYGLAGAPAPMPPGYDYVNEMASSQSYAGDLSARNIAQTRPGATGADAESYEVSDYNATLETGDVMHTCGQIFGLKVRPEVIFESATESKTNCYYRFKVAHTSVAGVLDFVKSLDPKTLAQNTYTIKNQIEDYTSQSDILKSKLAAIDRTLTDALAAYDDITSLAVKTQNADALAKIIENRVQMIDRLSERRVDISAQLEQLARLKAQELDRIDYTYFSVNVYKDVYIDGEYLADSWKAAVKHFVVSVNNALQQATIGIISFVVWAIPYIMYLFILLFVAKYGWRIGKNIWLK